MAMTAGSVTVADNGSASGTGFAKAIYDELIKMPADFGDPAPMSVAGKRGQASFANRLATALVGYMTANAEAKISTTDAGLQRDNTGGNPATLAPVADKFIRIV